MSNKVIGQHLQRQPIVQDGNTITAMDKFGNIITSTFHTNGPHQDVEISVTTAKGDIIHIENIGALIEHHKKEIEITEPVLNSVQENLQTYVDKYIKSLANHKPNANLTQVNDTIQNTTDIVSNLDVTQVNDTIQNTTDIVSSLV